MAQYKCNVSDCNEQGTNRGLCRRCYAGFNILINRKLTTPEELEELGIFNPKIKSGLPRGSEKPIPTTSRAYVYLRALREERKLA